VVEVAHRLARDQAPVAQDRDAIADLEHLLEVMGHVHDRVALVAELMDAGEQRLGLALGQRRRRLVEDQDLRRCAEDLGDLDELLGGERQRRDLGARVQPVQPDPLEHRLRLTVQLARAGDPAPRRQLAHQQVLLHRQVGQEAELLVDDADAGVAGLGRARRGEIPPFDDVLALVPFDRAGQDLDQRALAGAVLAGEAHDLAGAQLERDAVKRLDRPVGLRGAPQRHDGLGLGARLRPGVDGGAHPDAFAVGGLSSSLISGLSMFVLSASTAPGSRLSGGMPPALAAAASTTP